MNLESQLNKTQNNETRNKSESNDSVVTELTALKQPKKQSAI